MDGPTEFAHQHRNAADRLPWALALPAFVLIEHHRFFHDDAFISLRYCRNWIEGQGLVWNPGERVEGYTNFLHICFIRLLAMGGIDLPLAARWVGLISYAVLVLLLTRTVSARLGASWREPRVLTPVCLVASIPSMAIWAWGGLETLLVAALVFGGEVLLCGQLESSKLEIKRVVWAGLLLGLATLARPDGAAFFLGSLIALALFAGGMGRKAQAILSLTGAYAAVIVPHLLWRHSYYGEWVPNTFFAKADGLPLFLIRSGILYILRSVGQNMPFALLAAGFLIVYRSLLGQSEKFLLLVSSLFGLYIGFVGGDHMPGGRMLAPAFPLVGLALSLFWDRLRTEDSARGRTFGLLAIAGALVSLVVTKPRKMDPAATIGRAVGRYVAANWPAGSLVSCATAGSTPYYSPELQYIDALGLNDKVIARRKVTTFHTERQHWPGHMKGDGAYVLSRKPDYIILGPAEGTSADRPWFLTDYELGLNPQFAAEYKEEQVQIPVIETGWFGGEICSEQIFTYYRRVK